MNTTLCPCHSGVEYSNCCENFHKGERPKTALLLMRSRYAAFTMNLADYIIETTHNDNPQNLSDRDTWKNQIQDFHLQTKFNGLEIVESVNGAEEAFVTFIATLEQNGADASFKEKSKFLKVSDRWLYLSGEITPFADE